MVEIEIQLTSFYDDNDCEIHQINDIEWSIRTTCGESSGYQPVTRLLWTLENVSDSEEENHGSEKDYEAYMIKDDL